MSYGFDLINMPSNMSPDDYFLANEENDDDLPMTDEQYSLNQRIIAALLQYKPTLEVLDSHYSIEVTPDISDTDLTGILLHLFPNEAAISVPYWHKDERAKTVFKEIWDYLKIIQLQTGYAIYDPQVGDILNLSTDFETVVQIYADIVDRNKFESGRSTR
jgi:hypothetical protein